MTIPQAKKYIVDNYGEARHNVNALIKACRKLSKETKLDSEDLFFLLIENRPIGEEYTHSYGFHTRKGRYLIETLKEYYHENNSTTVIH